MTIELELIKKFKEEHLSETVKSLAKSGGLEPMVTIFGKAIKDKKSMLEEKEYGIFLFPVPPGLLDNGENKDFLVMIIHQLFDTLYKNNVEPVCYSWSSEGWMRIADKDDDVSKENWKNLDKIEVLMTTFETKDDNEMIIDKIIRNGKMPDENGNLIDCISLERYDMSKMEEKPGEMGGRFGSILKNYLKNKEKNEQSNA